jgi:AraC family transcriptional regulator
MEVEVLERPALDLASVHHVGSYTGITEAFRLLHELATKAGLVKGETRLVGIYHDDPAVTPEDKLRSDAGVTVPPNTKLPPGLTALTIPGGRYAHATLKGPYSGLGDLWNHLRNAWLSQSGEKLGKGMSYEVYRNTPMNAKPHELVTDLYLPLK